MALFRRKKEPEPPPADSRSKRGGVRRQTSVRIDLSELEKRAAPAAGGIDAQPVALPGGAAAPAAVGRDPSTRRMPAPSTPQAAVSRRSTRISGRGVPIGGLLIQAGAVNQQQVNQALKIQQKQTGLLGQILVAMGACLPEDVAAALEKQFRYTEVDLSTFKPKIDALLLLTPAKCRQLKAIPFEKLGDLICVAVVNVLNRTVKTQVETLTKLKMKGFKGTWPQIQQAIEKYYVGKVKEGARAVEEARTKGVRVDEFAAGVAEEIRTAIQAAQASKEAAQPAKAAATVAPTVPKPKPEPEVEAERYIKDAQALRAQDKLEEAMRRLKAGAAAVPGSKKLAALLGQVEAEVAAKAEAEKERLARVAELLVKGRGDREAGNFVEAVRKFEEAAKLDPENRVIARELSNALKEVTRKRAEELARRKAEEDARTLEEKRRTEEAKRLEREVGQLMGLARDAREVDRLDEAQSRLKDVLSLVPDHGQAKRELAQIEATIAQHERGRAEELATRLAAAQAAEEQKKLEDLRAEEERRRKEAHVAGVLSEAAQDREAGRLEIAIRKLEALAGEAHDREDVREAVAGIERDLEEKRAEEEKRRRAEEEKRRRTEEEIQRRAAAAAEVQAERQRMSAAATGGEKRLDVGTVTEDTLVEIVATPESWYARIAEALPTRGGEAASTQEALRQLPVAQRYARSRDELRAMAEAAIAAEAALEEVEEVTLGGDEAEIEAILEAIPEGDLGEEELAEVVEVIAIPETRLQAQAISEEEFARLEPELGPDPVLDWLATYAGYGRAAVVPVEE